MMKLKRAEAFPRAAALWAGVSLLSAFGEGVLEKESALSALTAAVAVRALVAILIPYGVWLSLKSRVTAGQIAALILSEIPYDVLLSGRAADGARQSPALAVCICLGAARLISSFSGKPLVPPLVYVMTFLWVIILRADGGIPIAASMLIIRVTEKREGARPIALAAALSLCSLISPYYALSPLGAMLMREREGLEGPAEGQLR